MNTTDIRKQLLANATAMCEYAERELAGVARSFEYVFERGFIYGHNCDVIKMFYGASSKKASIVIQHYGSSFSIRDKVKRDGTYRGGEDITEGFFSNFVAFDYDEVQKALTITQQNWQSIKSHIAAHKAEENAIFNFQV